MPIYVYKCACGRTQEKIRKISEREQPVQCDNFGCNELATPTVTAPGFVHGGFYDSLTKKA